MLKGPIKGSTEGYVYFVECPANGLIKIGWSDNPDRRFVALANVSPVPLRKLGLKKADRMTEFRLLNRFWRINDHSEWFRPEEGLTDFIRDWAGPWAERPSFRVGWPSRAQFYRTRKLISDYFFVRNAPETFTG